MRLSLNFGGHSHQVDHSLRTKAAYRKGVPTNDPGAHDESRRPANQRLHSMTESETAAFRLLGVKPGTTIEKLRAARAQAKARHPDLGGSDAEWRELEDAYDIAVAWTRNRMLPARRTGMELGELPSAEVVRLERRRDAQREASEVRDGLIRVHTSRPTKLKRTAWTLSVIGAITTGIAALLRSVAVPPLNSANHSTTTVLFGVLALASASAGLIGLIYRSGADYVESLIGEANEFLADRFSCLRLLDELEEVGQGRAPWVNDELRECVERWTSIGRTDSQSVARLARRIGPADFTKLLIARAIANELLEERFQEDRATQSTVQYTRRLPGVE
jgi:hypothetical protein